MSNTSIDDIFLSADGSAEELEAAKRILDEMERHGTLAEISKADHRREEPIPDELPDLYMAAEEDYGAPGATVDGKPLDEIAALGAAITAIPRLLIPSSDPIERALSQRGGATGSSSAETDEDYDRTPDHMLPPLSETSEDEEDSDDEHLRRNLPLTPSPGSPDPPVELKKLEVSIGGFATRLHLERAKRELTLLIEALQADLPYKRPVKLNLQVAAGVEAAYRLPSEVLQASMQVAAKAAKALNKDFVHVGGRPCPKPDVSTILTGPSTSHKAVNPVSEPKKSAPVPNPVAVKPQSALNHPSVIALSKGFKIQEKFKGKRTIVVNLGKEYCSLDQINRVFPDPNSIPTRYERFMYLLLKSTKKGQLVLSSYDVTLLTPLK